MNTIATLRRDAPRSILLRHVWWNLLCPLGLHPGVLRPTSGPARVIFVCAGNVCRSPYAERRAQQLGLRAFSYGLAAGRDDPPPRAAVEAAAKRGVDLSQHRSRPFDRAEVDAGDLLLVMEPGMLHATRRVLRSDSRDVSLLGLYNEPRGRVPYIPDPFGLPDSVFALVFAMIDECVEYLTNRFSTIEPSSPSAGLGR